MDGQVSVGGLEAPRGYSHWPGHLNILKYS